MDARLKAIQLKSQWGFLKTVNNNSIINIGDNEFVSTLGSRLVHVDINNIHAKESNIIDMLNNDILYVQQMIISPDAKYLATSVKMKDSVEIDSNGQRICNIYIYELKDRFRNLSVPRLIQYSSLSDEKESKNKQSSNLLLEITCMAFSHDSKYFAIGTNEESNNFICYDYQRGKVFQKLTLEATPRSISFNPNDSLKCCTVGDSTLFKFWRFTDKSVHAAPVVGLKIGVYAFTCHAWIPNADNHVLAGTNEGFVSLIQNCEQRVPIAYVTGNKQEFLSDEKKITNILVRGDIACAVTPTNCIAVYEIRKTIPSRGAPAANSKLIYLATFRLDIIDKLFGLQWTLKDTNTSYSMIGLSSTKTVLFDLSTENGMVSLAMQSDMITTEQNATGANKNGKTIIRFENVLNERQICSNHCQSINSLSLAVRNHTFVSASFEEAILKVWDYNDLSSFNNSYLNENYNKAGNTLSNPFHLDMHPSGLFVAFALENEVKEFGISDSQLDILRKINTKTAYVGPNGIPFNNNQPVSLVRYSNGGQYLAVVTGRVAQVFHCYMNSFESSVLGGEPVKVMILFDHSAPITDLVFLQDDTTIVTTSSDGTVYEWKVGESARSGEYLNKEASAVFLSASKTKLKTSTIIAYFSTKDDITSIAGAHVLKKKETEKLSRKMSTLPTGSNSIDFAEIKKLGTISESNSNSPSQRNRRSSALRNSFSENLNVTGLLNGFDDDKDKNFLAVWSGGRITPTPKIIHVDSPIKSIALGDTDGPDKLDICVIGLEDGRVLICSLPLPVRIIESVQPNITNVKVPSRSRLTIVSKKRYSISSNPTADSSSVVSTSTKSTVMSKNPLKKTSSSTSLQLNNIPEENMSENGDDQMPSPTEKNLLIEFLNENQCRNFRLHVGSVNQVSISRDGLWIFTAGADGCIFMLATSKRAKELTSIPHRSEILEDNFLVIDKTSIHTLRKNYIDTLNLIEIEKKESEMTANKIATAKDKVIADLEAKMKKEIQKRDETIIQGRLDYLHLNNLKKEEIEKIEKKSENAVNDIELMYERKLAQESLYLDKMRQAYDEYVIHSKLDLSETQKKAEQKLIDIENEKKQIQLETEKQKSTVLQYFDYVKIQNNEVLNGLEATQEEERYKLKEEVKTAKKAYQDAYNANLAEQAKFNRKLHALTTEIESKDMEVLKQKNDILWLNERISKLEQSLTQATQDLKYRTDKTDEWESKGGELQQKIVDLERIRKTLTTQLHSLREELGPKEESLAKATEKLQEMEREYELALNAILEKDSLLAQKSMSMHLQQKQIRDLRNLSMRKDAIIKRVATVFDDYRFALKQAYFSSEKRTVEVTPLNQRPSSPQDINNNNNNSLKTKKDGNDNNNNRTSSGNIMKSGSAPNLESSKKQIQSGVVEIIAQNPEMKDAFQKLNDMLTPYLKDNYTDIELKDDVEAVRIEQDRHMQQLENTVARVKSSLELVNEVASSKVHNHLNDNKTLLHEVNSLRTEVRSLSMENQRLQATIDFMNMKQKQSSNIEKNSFENKNKALVSKLKQDRDFATLKTDSFMDSTLSGTEPESFTPKNVKSTSGKKEINFDDDFDSINIDKRMSTSQQYIEHMKKYSNLNNELENKKPLTADEKIAALLEMNAKEIQAIGDKNNSLASKITTKKGKSIMSSSSDLSKSGDKINVQKVIGNATIDLPPVISKKK